MCPDDPALSIRSARSFVSRLVISTIHSEHAFDTADHAADCSTDHGADWTGTAVAFIRPVGDAAGNPLRMGGDRHRDDCNDRGRNKNSELHEVVLPVFWMATTGVAKEAIRGQRRALKYEASLLL
jgi:hypothetical protein